MDLLFAAGSTARDADLQPGENTDFTMTNTQTGETARFSVERTEDSMLIQGQDPAAKQILDEMPE